MSLLPIVTLFLGLSLASAAQGEPAGERPILQVFTSKLHYQPGEQILFGATVDAGRYPDQQSSKVLRLSLKDAAGEVVAEQTVQYGLGTTGGTGLKELRGVLVPADADPLPPGPYDLIGVSTDQRTGEEFESRHRFVVQAEEDIAVCETPFRFVKDFSLIRGPEERWHIFSIAGEFFDNHDWQPDGQERTFSHLSSPDLRTWTVHPPVLSVSDRTGPDGKTRYEDRNIWAPHVIEHDGSYYLFYTSVNETMSQSISLATSTDLFDWTPHPGNPVFTLDDARWAHWFHDSWSDCRDPMVLADGGRFYLYVTAHLREEPEDGMKGVVAVAESEDLVSWSRGRIAARGENAMESPQVWRSGDRFLMTVSAGGHGTWVSDHPAHGWEKQNFARPDVQAVDPHIETSRAYAEEVVTLPDGSQLMAVLTWRHFGNSIYFFRIVEKDGRVVGYEPVTALPVAAE